MRRRTFFGSVFAWLAATGYAARPPKPKAGDISLRMFGKTGEKVTVISQEPAVAGNEVQVGGSTGSAPQYLIIWGDVENDVRDILSRAGPHILS